MKRPLRILTWHIHGSYLYYLVQSGHEFYLPVKPGRPVGYHGRAGTFPWPANVYEVPAEEVRRLSLDGVLFQSTKNYLRDQYEILSPAQQRLPRIYLEHDPPREHPTDTRHIVDDPQMLLVHVTPFNSLMWDNGRTPTRVIEHGVLLPESVSYTGELPRGLVVVNNLRTRGRRLGADIFVQVRQEVVLDLVGMGAVHMGGLGEVQPPELPAFAARYRFFFNPIRYTSLGLAVCEAMMLGMPIIGLATTEMVTTVENGVSGYVDTDFRRLIPHMQTLLNDPVEARRLGSNARRSAQARFNIHRFIGDWNSAFALVTGQSLKAQTATPVTAPPSHFASFLTKQTAEGDGRKENTNLSGLPGVC
jgi:glycosyltransferase involved in cell wall biosynthesis